MVFPAPASLELIRQQSLREEKSLKEKAVRTTEFFGEQNHHHRSLVSCKPGQMALKRSRRGFLGTRECRGKVQRGFWSRYTYTARRGICEPIAAYRSSMGANRASVDTSLNSAIGRAIPPLPTFFLHSPIVPLAWHCHLNPTHTWTLSYILASYYSSLAAAHFQHRAHDKRILNPPFSQDEVVFSLTSTSKPT